MPVLPEDTIRAKLWNLFQDGKPHSIKEIETYFDEYTSRGSIFVTISQLRAKRLSEDDLLLCVIHNRSMHYQLVKKYQG